MPDGGSPGTVPVMALLRAAWSTLPPAEQRVADIVLDSPRRAASLTITQLSAAAQTSGTSVLRLARRLGLTGYPELRIALAEASAQAPGWRHQLSELEATDSVDAVVSKVAHADATAVEDTAQRLDRAEVAAVAKALAAAGRVDIVGIGASALVASDLQLKLHRIGRLAFAWVDPHLALTSASLLEPGDVAVAVSHSGTTVEPLEVLRQARQNGATTVAITNAPASPLGRAADHVLTTAATETALRSGATASRIAALVVVDILFLVTAQHDLDQALAAVTRTRAAVAGHHQSRHRRQR